MNLTASEKNIIKNLPEHLQEYLEAKFNPFISTYSDYDLEKKVKDLIIKVLFASGVKDAKDDKVVTFIRETFFSDIRKPRFSKMAFEEIELALEKGVRQEYGPFMGVNIQTIHTWIRAYLNSKEREMAIKEFHTKVSELEYGKEERNSKPNPEGQRKIIEMLKPFAVKKEETYIKKPKPKVEPTERDKFIQSCFKDFLELHKKKCIKTPGGEDTKFIMFNGSPVDEVEYTQIRLAEYDKQQIDN